MTAAAGNRRWNRQSQGCQISGKPGVAYWLQLPCASLTDFIDLQNITLDLGRKAEQTGADKTDVQMGIPQIPA
jgi:hypothetical protein